LNTEDKTGTSAMLNHITWPL